jgi:DNA ligase (NAD+)
VNFKKMTLAERQKLYIKAKHAYYEKKTLILTDGEFDKLEDLLTAEVPDWDELHKTGVRTDDGRSEIELPQFMPSLDKAYPEQVPKFVKRFAHDRFTGMDKLDGTSLFLRYVKGMPTLLVTRGDGTKGRDISFLIPSLVKLKRIPAEIGEAGVFDVRIEAVMAKKMFSRNWSKKVNPKYGADNARQLVNGAFLRKKASTVLGDIDLVVLGVYGMTIAHGLELADELGFMTVACFDNVRSSNFEKLLEERKASSKYEIDGMVFADPSVSLSYENAHKPKWIFAFKINNDADAYEVRILDIEYARTRLNRWSAVCVVNPTQMDGVVVERVTAHNAGWMMENGIGPGARIKVLRSGGVIPKIVGVVERAQFKEPPGAYEQRGRFLYALDVDTAQQIRALHFFMTTLGIELLAEKTLEKLYEVGFTEARVYLALAGHIGNRSAVYLKAGQQFTKAGLGEKQAENIFQELKRVLDSTITLKKLMVASGCFDAGMGERKLSQLEDAGISMRELGNMRSDEIATVIPQIKGFSQKTTLLIRDGVRSFRAWYKPIHGLLKIDGALPAKKATTGRLSGMKFTWTGYRAPDEEQTILANGGAIVSFSAKTSVLFYKEGGKASTKVANAGDRAMTWQQFELQYLGRMCA